MDRLRFIQKAKRLGLSLTEIGQIIALRAEGTAPCQQLKAMDQRWLEGTVASSA